MQTQRRVSRKPFRRYAMGARFVDPEEYAAVVYGTRPRQFTQRDYEHLIQLALRHRAVKRPRNVPLKLPKQVPLFPRHEPVRMHVIVPPRPISQRIRVYRPRKSRLSRRTYPPWYEKDYRVEPRPRPGEPGEIFLRY